jgi:ParB family chromosome partitioning protein
MSAKRATIGRTFNPEAFTDNRSEDRASQTFTLSTGRKAVFTLQTIPRDQVEDKTFVVQETNGRDQSALTQESLKDIISTLRLQQFFPCIGIQKGERIEIIDGSRRRASAIFCHTSLDVMVTQTVITADEARKLASAIQTAREHNLREVGLRLLALKESGLTQKEIAEREHLSQAKVTRALQAASVPALFMELFPVQSELTFSDYKSLLAVSESLSDRNITHENLIKNISSEIDRVLASSHLAEDEVKNRIVGIINREASLLATDPEKEKIEVQSLWTFPDKDRYARKRSKGRIFSYEFNRLSRDIQNELDAAIAEVLSKHLS